MKTKKDIKSSENIKMYCSNRNCSHLECVRHDKNIPFNILIKRENYKLDKNNECQNILLDWGDDV